MRALLLSLCLSAACGEISAIDPDDHRLDPPQIVTGGGGWAVTSSGSGAGFSLPQSGQESRAQNQITRLDRLHTRVIAPGPGGPDPGDIEDLARQRRHAQAVAAGHMAPKPSLDPSQRAPIGPRPADPTAAIRHSIDRSRNAEALGYSGLR